MSWLDGGGAGTTVTAEWNGRQVDAWRPAELSERNFSLTEPEARATERAAAALLASDAQLADTWEALARLLLRHEGIASSGIEGLREPLVSVLIAERTGAGGAAGWVADNLEVIRMALEESQQPLSVSTLHRWHTRLMRNSGLSADFIGSFRPRVGWVGGSSPLDAAYVPPPPGEIPELMDDLLRFADSGAGLDPVSHTAILHAQFEAIHPYADGNGRLGRVLVTRALRRADLTRRTTVPVSVAIARDPGGYLSGLAQFEQGNAGPWIRWFAEVAEKAAAATGSLATQTRHITEAWTRRLIGLRADSAARALVPLLAGHPVLCAPDVADLLGVSRPAARTALRALTDRGVLAPVEADSPGVGRNRHWFAAIDLINTWSS